MKLELPPMISEKRHVIERQIDTSLQVPELIATRPQDARQA